MPFNPVYNLKAANIWLQQSVDEPSNIPRSRSRSSDNTSSSESIRSAKSASLKSRQSTTITLYGLVCCFFNCFYDRICSKSPAQIGYVHVAFWAVFLYVLGSIVYVIDSILLWPMFNPSYSDDFMNPAIYLNLVGAAIFVIDAIVCFLDWHLQIQQIKKAEKLAKGDLLTAIAGISHSTSWLYFYNNIFFLAAAMIYIIQAVWYRAIADDLLRCERIICDAFWINFFGGLFYFASSYFCVLEYFEYQKMRRKQKLPPMLLFTLDGELFDWFGWGDWLYVFASLLSFVQSFFIFLPIDDDTNFGFNLLVNFIFLIDSLAYFVGYILFLRELEDVFNGSSYQRPAQVAVISEILNSSHVDESDSLLLGDEALSTVLEMPQVSISPSGGRKDDLPA